MTQRERDIFIALIDAGLDESAVLAFVEGEIGEAAGIVEALASDAHLAEMVWQMRADRDAVASDAQAVPVPAATLAMVSAVLDEEISNEIDTRDLCSIEDAGTDSADIAPPAHKPIKVRRVRRHAMRIPTRAPRIIGALAAAAVLVLIVSIALPNLDFGTSNSTPNERIAATDTELPMPNGANTAIADALPNDQINGSDSPLTEPRWAYRPEQQPIVVASAAEALSLAKEGRLIVRLTSYRSTTTSTLATQLTTGSDLMRFAAIEGKASVDETQNFQVALPKLQEPMMASADESQGGPRMVTTRESEGAYMLRVEPTERAFTMLIAKLKNYEGLTVELIGAASPITTPGSAADLSGLTGSPTTWKPRITVPVVVESIQ